MPALRLLRKHGQRGVVDADDVLGKNQREHDPGDRDQQRRAMRPVRVERVGRHLEAQTKPLVALAFDGQAVIALGLDELREQRRACTSPAAALVGARRRRDVTATSALPARELLSSLDVHDHLRGHVLNTLVVDDADRLHLVLTAHAQTLPGRHRRTAPAGALAAEAPGAIPGARF
jgi:hypothetical protein